GSSGNTTTSLPFTVANWASAAPIQISVSSPTSNAPVAGQIGITGTAVSQLGAINSVTVTIDDLIVAQPATYTASNGNWSYTLDTTILPDGVHTLNVTANIGGSTFLSTAPTQQTTVSTTFTVENYTF